MRASSSSAPNGLVTWSRADVERPDLVVSAPRADRITIGRSRSRGPAADLDAIDVGQAEIEHDLIPARAFHRFKCARPFIAVNTLIRARAAAAPASPRCSARHRRRGCAAGMLRRRRWSSARRCRASRWKTARPPPATFSAQTRPPIAVKQPAGNRQAHAGARRRLRRVAPAIESLEQLIDLRRVRVRDPDRDGDREPFGPRRASTMIVAIGGGVARRIVEQVRQRHRRQSRVDVDGPAGVGVDPHVAAVDAWRACAMAASTTSAGVTHSRCTSSAAARSAPCPGSLRTAASAGQLGGGGIRLGAPLSIGSSLRRFSTAVLITVSGVFRSWLSVASSVAPVHRAAARAPRLRVLRVTARAPPLSARAPGRGREVAADDAATRNATSDTQLCASAIEKVPTGAKKK